ncbi:GlyGly-CTERM sorting domain-containing protein [Stenotrophomonas maltophilia]|nr:GlyGly-CTERM sorting domain-containing protein [Stenotrophomonas maltophilia]MBA0368686.1 GlyGly-CTERM sorting domain-containing protein [Stenotrophomonas maltophilia]MBA0402950.1 GlyGly-CTERM sorting domain-containing protein [Stenotrophomonas maltophilia]
MDGLRWSCMRPRLLSPPSGLRLVPTTRATPSEPCVSGKPFPQRTWSDTWGSGHMAVQHRRVFLGSLTGPLLAGLPLCYGRRCHRSSTGKINASHQWKK